LDSYGNTFKNLNKSANSTPIKYPRILCPGNRGKPAANAVL